MKKRMRAKVSFSFLFYGTLYLSIVCIISKPVDFEKHEIKKKVVFLIKKIKNIMLKTFLPILLISSFSFSQTCTREILNDPFDDASSWDITSNNSLTSITNGKAYFDGISTSSDNKIVKQLSNTISSSSWKAEIDLSITQANGASVGSQFQILALTEGNLDFSGTYISGNYTETNQNGIVVVLGSISQTDGNMDNWGIRLESKLGSTRTQYFDQQIFMNSTITDYFISLEKQAGSETYILSVFTDAARTTHIAGSPTTTTVAYELDALTHAQIGNFAPSNASRKIYASVDNLVICDDQLSDLNDEKLENVGIYPNPLVNDLLKIKSASNFKKLEITNEIGQTVSVFEKIDSEIDLSKLESGCYYLKFTDSNESIQILKLIKP